jgi:hypothetical protein
MAFGRLGECYEHGWGMAPDYAEARTFYERTIAAGADAFLLNLGELYEFGRDTPQDGLKALELYRKAQENGRITAASHIARLYEFGRGVPQSFPQALGWYERDLPFIGSENAHRMAVLCEQGAYVKRNIPLARRFHDASTDALDAFQMGLSYLHETNAQGKAYRWLLVAKLKGYGLAEQYLPALSKRFSPAERKKALADAQGRVRFDSGESDELTREDVSFSGD